MYEINVLNSKGTSLSLPGRDAVTGLVECPDARWILLGYGWYIICIYTMSIYALECSYAMLLYGIPHVSADMFTSSFMMFAYDTYIISSYIIIFVYTIYIYIYTPKGSNLYL